MQTFQQKGRALFPSRQNLQNPSHGSWKTSDDILGVTPRIYLIITSKWSTNNRLCWIFFPNSFLSLSVLVQAWETENTRKKGEINESLKAFKQFGFGLTEEMVKGSKCGFYWQMKVFIFSVFP